MVEESDLLEQLKVCINTVTQQVLDHNSVHNEQCSTLYFFQIIKDFYLLGRGELYQVFIDLAQHMLKTPPTAVTEHGRYLICNNINKICEVVFYRLYCSVVALHIMLV